MVVSVSRRTDIPAYYADWFIHRIRAGFCETVNPFFPEQRKRISLTPDDVDCFVFWTRNPERLIPYLPELDEYGYPYYFLYTVVDYPAGLEPGSESLQKRLEILKSLSTRIGPGRIVWRYDPILVTKTEGFSYHVKNFTQLAAELRGYTNTAIISFYDDYRKCNTRLGKKNIKPLDLTENQYREETISFLKNLRDCADQAGMELQSCGESFDTGIAGIQPGSCIDADRMHREFSITVSPAKDRGQRKLCRCIKSTDIGMYDTCIRGCLYCYATTNPEKALYRYTHHNPESTTQL